MYLRRNKMKIRLGDCLEEMRTMEDSSVDSIVTDPPYGLSFMGKKWDYDVPSVEIWKECLRVLKPGGYLLSFAGTRTQHRMAVNIEDAGFEIRDMIAWVYGSGFPKSHNIGKAVDKRGGVNVGWFGDWLREWRKENNIAQKEISKLFPSKTGGLTGCVANWELGFNMPTNEQFNLICKTFNLPFSNLEEAKREVIGKNPNWRTTKSKIACPQTNNEPDMSKGNSPYEGWGTALKPALEPITVARKPFKGTVANNVLKWGTGGINIDGCRVGSEITKTCIKDLSQAHGNQFGKAGIKYPTKGFKENKPGRFPANLIHDGSEEVVGLFNDSARFFYCAKASKSERNEGCEGLEEKKVNYMAKANGTGEASMDSFSSINRNHHPTVKPVKLMQYLVRLVTPKDGTVLDPFMGSGSTGIACKKEGFNFIGIELAEDYCNIAKTRIEKFKLQHELF